MRVDRTGRRRGAAVIAVLALAIAGCNSGDDNGGGDTTVAPGTTGAATSVPAPTTTAASSVTTAPVVPNMNPTEIEVRNALDVYHHTITRSYENPDPTSEELLDLITGSFRDKVVANLSKYRNEGTYFKRPDGGVSPHRTNTVEFSPDGSAIAHECIADDLATYRRGQVEPVENNPETVLLQSTLVRGADGRWRITTQTPGSKVEALTSCRGL